MRTLFRAFVGASLVMGALVLIPTVIGTAFGVAMLAAGIGFLTGDL